MDKTYTLQIEVTVTEETLSNLISNVIDCPDQCGIAWWKTVNKGEYDAAEVQLEAEGRSTCSANVFARVLLNGGKLRLLDPESDWHWSGHEDGEMLWKAQIIAEGCYPVYGEWHDVGIMDILRAAQQYADEKICNDCGSNLDDIVEDGDFWDADAVFQIAMYGEVIYG